MTFTPWWLVPTLPVSKLLAASAVIAFFPACKPKAPRAGFVRQEGSASQFWGEITFDSSGKSKERIVMPLDFTLSGRPITRGLPSCLPAVTDDNQVIGELICSAKPEHKEPLRIGQVQQQCYAIQTGSGEHPPMPIQMTDCTRAQVRSFVHDPELRLDIVAAD